MTEILNDKSVLVALGDGGPHADMLCDAGYPMYLPGTWVRERQALTLEEGVRRLTLDPAEVFGVRAVADSPPVWPPTRGGYSRVLNGWAGPRRSPRRL